MHSKHNTINDDFGLGVSTACKRCQSVMGVHPPLDEVAINYMFISSAGWCIQGSVLGVALVNACK